MKRGRRPPPSCTPRSIRKRAWANRGEEGGRSPVSEVVLRLQR
ncbi:MAG: hypothetical protein ACRD1T_10310 [Acidimicrobiia bacterium]